MGGCGCSGPIIHEIYVSCLVPSWRLHCILGLASMSEPNFLDKAISFYQDPTFYAASAILGVGVGLLWHTIAPATVKAFFDRRLEEMKRTFVRADKSAVVTDVVALMEKGELDAADVLKINKALLELSLYLPACLVHKMAHTLVGDGSDEDLGNPRELITEIRNFIHGTYKPNRKSVFSAQNIPQLRLPTDAEKGGGTPREAAPTAPMDLTRERQRPLPTSRRLVIIDHGNPKVRTGQQVSA